MSFTNKVVLVTGASSGIGAAVAVAVSAEGAKVALVGRNEKKLAEVAARCSNPLVLRADITNDDEAKNIIDQTIKTFGQLDVLVNNAGHSAIGSIFIGDIIAAYDSIMNTNLRAIIHLTSLAAPYLVKTKGNIVIISSVAGQNLPLAPGTINYNVSKAAVNHFSRCAAAELASYGVRVNTVSPGPVETDFLENSKLEHSWDDYRKLTALNRVSEPMEIADIVMFLASDKAKGVTGSNYVSDNGLSIRRR